MTTISYDDYTFDTETLPEASVAALLNRGLTHFLGNEQAAKVTAKIRAHLRNGKGKDFEVTRDMVRTFRENPGNESQVSQWMKDAQASAVDALNAGTVGEISRGAKLSTIDKVMRDVARDAIKTACAAKGKPMPKGENLAEMIEDLVTGPYEQAIRTKAEARLSAAAEITVNV